MAFFLSIIPIALILFLMVGLRWGAARAGAAGYLTALAISILFFGSGPKLLAYAHAKALLLSMDVLMIIWAAFFLYRVADEAGAIRTIGEALPHVTNDRGMQALIIGWVFATFLQGIGGFGVPVAVIAPILIGLGFAPLAAVVIPSIGHGWAVTFGSLGSSFQALIASTGLPWEQLVGASAVFMGISGVFVGWMVAHAAGGFAAVRRLFWPALVFGIVMGTTQLLVAVSGFWNIGAFIAGIAGLLVGIPLARRYRGDQQNNGALEWRLLLVALSGYAAMVVIVLAVQLIPLLSDFLGKVVISVNFPEVSTRLGYVTQAGPGRKIPLFRHAGMVLAYAAMVAFFIYRGAGLYRPGAMRRILGGTVRRVLASTVSIFSMVTMAVIMEHAGMTDALARGIAERFGSLFPLFAPWIGALGAFMTGSTTNSNVVFGALQLRTAQLLGFSAAIILAGQTAGASLASVMAPTKVVVGTSTAGMSGREGDVLRRLLVYTGLLVLLISLLTVVAVWLGL
jgi:lactate permease